MKTFQGTVRPLNDHVIVQDMNFGERVTDTGIVLLEDGAKAQGIRPRWGLVYAVGPKQTEVKPGQWILVSHGRWTRGFRIQASDSDPVITVRRVDNQDILAVSDEPVQDLTINSDAV